ncbi:unnamed protein product [Penicillium salamii]|nr:unnamed protein product [Penicillium salamii]
MPARPGYSSGSLCGAGPNPFNKRCIMDRYPRNDSIVQSASRGLQAYMAQVYGWMTCGLLLTAFVSWYAARTPAIMELVFANRITFFGLIIVQLGLVFFLSGMVHRLSGAVATGLFMLYSALTGLTMASIFLVYTNSSIASTFFITAGMFGAMSSAVLAACCLWR